MTSSMLLPYGCSAMIWLAGVGAAPHTQYDVLRPVELTAVHPSMAPQAEGIDAAELEGEPCMILCHLQVRKWN